jgi:cation transport ATPase
MKPARTLLLAIALAAMVLMAVATLVFSALNRPIPLSLGVVTHEGGTLLVVLNSLLLLKFKK